MSHPSDFEREELQLKKMLRSMDANVPPPDLSVLRTLRQQSLEQFEHAGTAPPVTDSVGGLSTDISAANTTEFPSAVHVSIAPAGNPDRRPQMFTFAMRAVTSLVIGVAVLTTWVINGPAPVSARPVVFAQVLEQLRSSGTLEFQLVKDGTASSILVREPRLVRKQETPQHYAIANGTRLWTVDESDNSVTESASPWFDTQTEQVDLVGLLGLDIQISAPLLKARPVAHAEFPMSSSITTPADERVELDATRQVAANVPEKCLVYRVELPAADRRRIRVEAFVKEQDNRLLGIQAWPADRQRNAGAPLAEMRLVALNAAVPDDAFEVNKSLSEDGRIGKVVQQQGIVLLRPMTAQRWTPVCSELLLRPGDWLRTELRGANAVRVRLTSDVQLTLGPGSLLEVQSPSRAKLHLGMVQIEMAPLSKTEEANDQPDALKRANPPGNAFTLAGPQTDERVVKRPEGDQPTKIRMRVDRNQQLTDVAQVPVWLAGFEGSSAEESLGSLIVNLPDGRNEPLTVGEHKVSVEIRDQIARTTIIETFVNHTPQRLEGIFHFPLPQDASISGFGMWIGKELVEADVVEKQRAREIYETILRERRDPGLLEWVGGNIFKARVFPIEPNSEKRIKIVYTQVLPLRGNEYRYNYGLRSELLRTKPLRELSLSVTVNSSLGLKQVTCPTHAARRQMTAHSAQVEFSAQEYTPTRDFELVCEIDQQQSDVVMIPHQRGDDGYFMVQITPPFRRDAVPAGASGARLNELIPDGAPLNLVLLCDTSASMGHDKRKELAQFVATVTSTLGPTDRFQVAACDVGTNWAFSEPVAPTAETLATASTFLEQRQSLGWTNLDRAFADVLKKAVPGAHIVYIGDGLLSAGDTDPAAFIKRLGRLVAQHRHDQQSNAAPVTLHAITVGNTSEAVVMKGIATVGKGSTRTIGGDQSPTVVAREFLNEIAQPGLSDVAVEFRGLKVAAVYPEQLPNLPAGTQQILVGRYLPEPGQSSQQGEVIVTGRRGNQNVKYAARVSLQNAEAGNSFIPRLWARSQLDFLLSQGRNSAIQDEIIRLSEEFHIITPYTSLLVLETDADRERFGVQRRYEMRDGERYFAQGRSNANFELLQQQMKQAGTWRLGLRRQILLSLAKLGRDPQFLIHGEAPVSRAFGPMSGRYSGYDRRSKFGFGVANEPRDESRLESLMMLGNGLDMSPGSKPMIQAGMPMSAVWDFESAGAPDSNGMLGYSESKSKFDGDFDGTMMGERLDELNVGLNFSDEFGIDDDLKSSRLAADKAERLGRPSLGGMGGAVSFRKRNVNGRRGWGGGEWLGRGTIYPTPDYTSWVNTLFPQVPPVYRPFQEKAPEFWTPEAVALAKRLLRMESLLQMSGGIEIAREDLSLDPAWNRITARQRDLVLYSPQSWLTRGFNPAEQTLVQFCDGKERGIYSLAFLLGQIRTVTPNDLKSPPLGLSDFSISSLIETYSGYQARTEATADGQTVLVFSLKDNSTEIRFAIDTKRNVILKRTTLTDGQIVNETTYDNFEEVAGSWWATRVVSTDQKGRTLHETQLIVRALEQAAFTARIAAELTAKDSVQFLHRPFVPVRVARQQVTDGSADFDARMTMILFNAQLQQWDELWKQVDAAEKLAADKPGVRWMRTLLLATIRRNEEALQRYQEEARKLLPAPIQDGVFLADFIIGQTASITAASETQQILEMLHPVYQRPFAQLPPSWNGPRSGIAGADDRADAELQRQIATHWSDREVGILDALAKSERATSLQQQLAREAPWDVSRQQTYAQRLANSGQFAAAIDWLKQELNRPEHDAAADENLRGSVANLYRQQMLWPELLAWTTDWIGRNPSTYSSQSSGSPYCQHLAAMIDNDRLQDALALAQLWLKEARTGQPLTPLQRNRLDAALTFATGSLYDLYFRHLDDSWVEPLLETVHYFANRPKDFDIVQRCVGIAGFINSDVGDQLRGEWLNQLRSDFSKLDARQIASLVGWTLSGRLEFLEPLNGRKQLDASEVPDDIWKSIAEHLKQRWQQTQDADERYQLSESLRSIYQARFSQTMLLPFLRERIPLDPEKFRQQEISTLFDAILAAPWTEEIEQEAFSLLPRLNNEARRADRLTTELPALLRLDDAMLANRIARGEKELKDQGGLDKLTRKELAQRRAEIQRAARAGLATRLERIAQELAADPHNVKKGFGLREWIMIERTWLQVALGEHRDEVQEFCWSVLGELPPTQAILDSEAFEEPTENPDELDALRQSYFDSLLRDRALITNMKLAVRKDAKPEDIDRLLKYLDAGIAADAKSKVADVDTAQATHDAQSFWRVQKFRFLVALDRPDQLDTALRSWIRDDVSTSPWRQYLARLLAERGQIDEAIALFEACQKDKLLSAEDFQSLAKWYLVVNRRADYEQSLMELFLMQPEWQLQQEAWQTQNRFGQPGSPTEIDERTLLLFKALIQKSSQPQLYLSQLQAVYAATHDFRLMQMLPDAVLGRSPQQIYDYLNGLQNQILYQLRNEATADEILSRIKSLREGKLTVTDLRALDLLEAAIERKSAELLNAPGPHVDACVAALQRAFQRTWAEGEPRLVAQFLAGFGGVSNARLRAEQLSELRTLRKLVPETSRDHLQITISLGMLLFRNYNEHGEALQLLEPEIRGYLQANAGQWPHADQDSLSSYIEVLQGANRHAAGETLLKELIDTTKNDEQRRWLIDRLSDLYNMTLEHDGAVSLGSTRQELLPPLFERLVNMLPTAADETARYYVVSRLNSALDIAWRNKVRGVAALTRRFAFEIVPEALRRQQNQYQNTASTGIHTITQVLGNDEALRYLVERMEQWPQRLQLQYNNAWNAMGYELAARREVASTTEYNDRILKLATDRLQEDLRYNEAGNQALYHAGHPHFWKEKTPQFALAAEKVLQERRSSGRRAMAVAVYLRHGLQLQMRSTEILLVANSKGLLPDADQFTLATWLHEENRFAEMIPVLEHLIAAHPDQMLYRTELMVAYFQSHRPEQLGDLTKQTEEFFHQQARWTEGNVAQFARGCQGTEQFEQAQKYFTEAIALHQRANPGSGLNDQQLSDYYQQLASVESRLSHTDAAVDAASSAIICWGAQQGQRTDALNSLRSVLSAATDLDQYVQRLDATSNKTGEDSPILRKAIGQVYQQRSEFAKAITQLQLALSLQPNDTEVHQALLACFDATQQPQEATRQLLQLIDLQPHSLPLYQQLAERLKGNEAEAERAATSIIESSPNEAESQTAMAEWRQSQGRWDEAIPHWEQVAQLRKLEPTGLLKLAEAQIHEKQWDAARQSLQKLNRTDWPPRFNNVTQETQRLQNLIPR